MREGLLATVLEAELELCRTDPSLSLPGIAFELHGSKILARFSKGRDGKPGVFQLDCSEFDANPPSVAMIDFESWAELTLERWTPGVPHSIHPVTGRPFVCLQGIAEYHTHPSHVADSWDRYRKRFRIPQTVRRLLQKAGAIP